MNETQIQKYERQGLEVLGDTEEMRGRLNLNSERLELVHDFIETNFREAIDFGPADPRNPKPTLLKPGAERICKLFNTRPAWRMDADTWRMLGEPKGVVCYLCEIVDNTTGEVVGEGRGAEKVGNKARDANKAIKAAEKCALVDAALYTFGLSERFTQDGPVNKNDLDAAKAELSSFVEDLRMGCESTLTNNRFIHAVIADLTKGSTLNSIGAVKAVRKAIEDGRYDLATGKRADKDPDGGSGKVRKDPSTDEKLSNDAPGRDFMTEISELAKVRYGADWFDHLNAECKEHGINLGKMNDEEAVKIIGLLSGQLEGGQ